MFSPQAIARSKVVYAREVLEAVDGRLAGRDAELVLELAARGDAHAALARLLALGGEVVERVRAARVRPHVRERDLLRRALLQEQLPVARPEDERGEGAVQEALVDVLHQVACGRIAKGCQLEM